MPNLEKPLSTTRTNQFNLRTMFALFFCLSVGLTIGIRPSTEFESWVDLLSSIPGIAYEVLLTTGSTAIVIGLVQQVVRLRKLKTSKEVAEPIQQRTLLIAISWRLAVAVLLALCLLFEMLQANDFLKLRVSDGFIAVFYGQIFPAYIRYACILIVLCDYRNRLTRAPVFLPHNWGAYAVAIAAFFLAILILPPNLIVNYLVYVALAEVEMVQEARFQRPGTYPNHQADGFFFFWIACAAVGCLFTGTILTHWLVTNWKRPLFLKLILGMAAIALLSCSIWYGIWYHTIGLPRIAPELAKAGFQSGWREWVEAAVLLAILVTAVSVRIASDNKQSVEKRNMADSQKPVLHESLPVLLIFAATAIIFPIDFLIQVFQPTGFAISIGELFFYMATDINYYFPIAVYLLILQILWMRWKHGPAQCEFRLSAVDWRKFIVAWLSIILFAIIGIPTIAAYSFSCWLGSWYLQ